MRHFATATAIAALFAAMPAVAQQQGSQQQQPQQQQQQAQSGQQQGQVAQQAKKFAEDAYVGNRLEIALGEAARQQAQNQQVKDFGQQMVQDHGEANKKLNPIIENLGIQAPTELPQDKQQTVDQMKQKQGQEFDKAYMQKMVEEHQKDVDLYKKNAEQLQNEELKSYAQNTLSTLEQHLQKAQQISQQVGAMAQSGQQQQGQQQQGQQGQKQQAQQQQGQQGQQQTAEAQGTDVIVEQGAPKVGVDQPRPEVTVVDPEPKVQVETPEPQVTVDQPKPEVQVEQAEPKVTMDKAEGADVKMVERETTTTGEQQQAQQRQPQDQQQAETQQRQQQDQQQAETQQRQPQDQEQTAMEEAGQEVEQTAEQAGQEMEQAGESTVQTTEQTAERVTGQDQQSARLPNLEGIVGMSVYGQNNEEVGEVSEVLMDPQGKVERVVIDRGGFLGIGEKEIAIGMDKLQMQQDRLIVNMTDQQISEMPEYEGQ
ncbi:DUF4142 domain-containing protein [Caenispirillum salinarum]|uniref:DUF4142 domain-containing protein n=1 Tax=Caenispirillum salinarum TaxID=859058 RepID=UPI00385182C8